MAHLDFTPATRNKLAVSLSLKCHSDLEIIFEMNDVFSNGRDVEMMLISLFTGLYDPAECILYQSSMMESKV